MLRALLGDVLREERRERGWTLRELAGLAGISATYLGEVERGLKEPSFEVVEAVARALELTAAEILRRLADRVDLRLARARYAFRQVGDTVSDVLNKLEQNTEKLSPDDRAALLAGLADLYIRMNKGQDAKRLWTQLAQLQPKNLRVRMTLCELAYLTGTEAALGDFEPLLREIRAIEGANGPQWSYAQACRIILAVRLRKAKPDQLAEARELLAHVMDKRPNWGRAVLRQAELAQLEGSPESTIVDLYKRALNLGERDPAAFHTIVFLLYQRGNLLDAEKMIAKLQEQTPDLPTDLRQMRILILGQLGKPQDALELAEIPDFVASRLRHPEPALILTLPVRLDDGTVASFPA